MIGVFEKQVLLIQAGADTTTTGVMDLNVDLERNEAYKVKQVAISLRPEDVLDWPAMSYLGASVSSVSGSLSYGVTVVVQALGVVDARRVIQVQDAPPCYEDSITVTIVSMATLIANTVRCRVTYEVIQGSELARTQYLYGA